MGSIPAVMTDRLWQIAGAATLDQWMAQCNPVLCLFFRVDDYLYPYARAAAFAELAEIECPPASSGGSEQGSGEETVH
jgi:hypothetical protein